jgi:hypothetical protein
MCMVSCVLEEEDLVDSEDLKDMDVCDIVLQYAKLLVSCDVERTFLQYKPHFHDNRHRFTTHNLKLTFVVHCECLTSCLIWRLLVSTLCEHAYYF